MTSIHLLAQINISFTQTVKKHPLQSFFCETNIAISNFTSASRSNIDVGKYFVTGGNYECSQYINILLKWIEFYFTSLLIVRWVDRYILLDLFHFIQCKSIDQFYTFKRS